MKYVLKKTELKYSAFLLFQPFFPLARKKNPLLSWAVSNYFAKLENLWKFHSENVKAKHANTLKCFKATAEEVVT